MTRSCMRSRTRRAFEPCVTLLPPLLSPDPCMHIESFTCLPATPLAGQACVLELRLRVDEALVFAPDVGLELFAAGCEQPTYQSNLLAQVHVGWLPRGRYRVRWRSEERRVGKECVSTGSSR